MKVLPIILLLPFCFLGQSSSIVIKGSGSQTILKSSGNLIPLKFGSQPIDTSNFVRATDYGVKTDYETIAINIDTLGRVSGVGRTLTISDVGKVMLIQGSKILSTYSTLPVPMNAYIDSFISTNLCRVKQVTRGESFVFSEGRISAANGIAAEMFTNNAVPIRNALVAKRSLGKAGVLLPAGIVGVMPLAASYYDSLPYLDVFNFERGLWYMANNDVLMGAGKSNTTLKFVEWGGWPKSKFYYWEHNTSLFFFEPVANSVTTYTVGEMTIQTPNDDKVVEGFSMKLFRDHKVSSPQSAQRHAIHATFSNINFYGRSFGQSNFGGVYNGDGTVRDETVYTYNNCILEGGSYFNNQNSQNPNKGGKRVVMNNVTIQNSAEVTVRHYNDSTVYRGDSVLIANRGFSWYYFNQYSDVYENAFNPNVRLRRGYVDTIVSIAKVNDEIYNLTVKTNSPVTKAGASVWINQNGGEAMVYLQETNNLISGSKVIAATQIGLNISEAEIFTLVGKPIKIYYSEEVVRVFGSNVAPAQIISPTLARVYHVSGDTLKNIPNLDATVNYSPIEYGIFSHVFYDGVNVKHILNNVTLNQAGRRSFRSGDDDGIESKEAVNELTKFHINNTRGFPAFALNRTSFYAAAQFRGKIIMRDSSDLFTEGDSVRADLNGGSYLSANSFKDGNVVRNSTIYGRIFGSGNIFDSSDLQIQLIKGNFTANYCSGYIYIDSSVASITNSHPTKSFEIDWRPEHYNNFYTTTALNNYVGNSAFAITNSRFRRYFAGAYNWAETGRQALVTNTINRITLTNSCHTSGFQPTFYVTIPICN